MGRLAAALFHRQGQAGLSAQSAVAAASKALQKQYADASATTGDGLRLDWPDRWVQVRASNTEPILRVIAEAPDRDAATKLLSDAVAVVRKAVAD